MSMSLDHVLPCYSLPPYISYTPLTLLKSGSGVVWVAAALDNLALERR